MFFHRKKKAARRGPLSFFCYMRASYLERQPSLERWLEPDLWAGGGVEVVAGAVVQEHDFVPGFHAETEPARVEFNTAARIKDAIGVAVNDIVDLVVDYAGRDWTADAEVYKTAFQQPKDPHGAGALNLETEKPVQQPQIRADGGGKVADCDDLALGALKVIGHFAFQNDMGTNVDAETPAHAKHVEVGRVNAGKVQIQAQVTVVFIITALGGSRGREHRDRQRQSAQNGKTFHVFPSPDFWFTCSRRTLGMQQLLGNGKATARRTLSFTMPLPYGRWAGQSSSFLAWPFRLATFSLAAASFPEKRTTFWGPDSSLHGCNSGITLRSSIC